MTIALWCDQLETGIDLIDAQHKALFESLNKLADALVDGTPRKRLDEGLALIAQHTVKHFQTEETLMKDCDYPDRRNHSDQHNELILQVRSLQYQQAKGQPINMGVAAFLADGFGHHIKEADMGYVGYIRAKAAS